MRFLSTAFCLLAASIAHAETNSENGEGKMFPKIETFITAREAEFDQISSYRKEQLEELSDYVRRCVDSSSAVELLFVCTHNSRRSQMSQVWARAAAEHYGLPKVTTYSGGTEATAFNPRAVAALKRAGFKIETEAEITKDADKKNQNAKKPEKNNPIYQVHFAQDAEPMSCFSKVFYQTPNPKKGFCAVMTCAQADKACPAVPGATLRLAIPFDDPKVADNTPEETKRYDERCAQIAREMLYSFSKVKAEDRVANKEN